MVSGADEELGEIAVHLRHDGDRAARLNGRDIIGALLDGLDRYGLRLDRERLHAGSLGRRGRFFAARGENSCAKDGQEKGTSQRRPLLLWFCSRAQEQWLLPRYKTRLWPGADKCQGASRRIATLGVLLMTSVESLLQEIYGGGLRVCQRPGERIPQSYNANGLKLVPWSKASRPSARLSWWTMR